MIRLIIFTKDFYRVEVLHCSSMITNVISKLKDKVGMAQLERIEIGVIKIYQHNALYIPLYTCSLIGVYVLIYLSTCMHARKRACI